MTSKVKAIECVIFSTIKSPLFSDREIEEFAYYILQKLKVRGSLSVHCIGDARMRSLNFRYRGKDATTDVLTFPLSEGEDFFENSLPELGDIFISVPQIRRQARELGINPQEEFVRMLIHGVLHSIGYDHMTKDDAEKMFGLQEKLLSQLV